MDFICRVFEIQFHYFLFPTSLLYFGFYFIHPEAFGDFIVPCPRVLFDECVHITSEIGAFVPSFQVCFTINLFAICFFFFFGGGGGLGSCSGLVERISGKLFPRVNDRLRFLDLLIPCKKLLSKHLLLLSI